jgi:guanosine-3',5'-bis(diphosphate) 3'-pyrophosphohydrolase
MSTSPLRPLSLSDASDGVWKVAPEALVWPGVFDAPATVDRVWTDFVAGLEAEEERHALRYALAFARARHGRQMRRGSDTPYWVHLVRVAMELSRWGESSPEVLQAALLHDTVEDTPTSIAEIRAGFGDEVAGLVDWLTCPDAQCELAGYYERLAVQAPLRAQLIKLADRTDNLRSIQALVMRTGDEYRAWAGTYLDRTVWQVLPLAAAAPSIARVSLVTAMADLAPLVEEQGFTEP